MKKIERDKLREILESTDKGWVRDVAKLLNSYECMVEALKFYANQNHLNLDSDLSSDIIRTHWSGLIETGYRARESLKEVGEE